MAAPQAIDCLFAVLPPAAAVAADVLISTGKPNPRLDMLCLTDEASVAPTDDMARAAPAE